VVVVVVVAVQVEVVVVDACEVDIHVRWAAPGQVLLQTLDTADGFCTFL
jgi:hypothetical protein